MKLLKSGLTTKERDLAQREQQVNNKLLETQNAVVINEQNEKELTRIKSTVKGLEEKIKTLTNQSVEIKEKIVYRPDNTLVAALKSRISEMEQHITELQKPQVVVDPVQDMINGEKLNHLLHLEQSRTNFDSAVKNFINK